MYARALLFAIAVMLTMTSRAAADPISPFFDVRVVSGSVLVEPGDPSQCCRPPETGPHAVVSLTGTAGVVLTASAFAFGGLLACEFGCDPGSVFQSPTGFVTELHLTEGLAALPDQPGPIHFSRTSGADVVGAGWMAFTTFGSLALPANPSTGHTFSAPFTFTGSLGVPGFLPPSTPDGDPVPVFLRAAFTGAGTATTTFGLQRQPDGIDRFVLESVRYDFENHAVVPEPASIGLLATGLAVLAARRRQKGRTVRIAQPSADR
jgi:PEP-CTERM motif